MRSRGRAFFEVQWCWKWPCRPGPHAGGSLACVVCPLGEVLTRKSDLAPRRVSRLLLGLPPPLRPTLALGRGSELLSQLAPSPTWPVSKTASPLLGPTVSGCAQASGGQGSGGGWYRLDQGKGVKYDGAEATSRASQGPVCLSDVQEPMTMAGRSAAWGAQSVLHDGVQGGFS